MSSNTSWFSIRENGTRTGIALLVACYSLGGAWLFRMILFPVMCFYFVIKGDARQGSALYLQKLHDFNAEQPKPKLRHSFYHFWQFGQSLLDKFSVWMRHITIDDVQLTGSKHFEELLSQGTGGVIFLSHLGNFEICHALSKRHPNFRLTILHHSEHTAKFNKTLSRYVDSDHVEMMQVNNLNIATAIRLSEKIANGEFIALAADRIPINNTSAIESIDFLGQPAAFPSGPFTLAMALKAPMLTLFCIKVNGQYHIHFNKLLTPPRVRSQKRDEARKLLMTEYVEQLQQFCLKAPWQWFNFYNFWDATALNKEQENDR